MSAVDLFSGLGGFTEGARIAGVPVVWAGNHWEPAVRIHAMNHPDTQHVCQDLHLANWCEVPAHDLLLAAPSCQGHTPARGKDRPHHDAARATAWAVVSCVEVHRPPAAIVENVPAMTNWVLYPAWCHAMAALGYTLSPHVLDAANYGVPQNRKRLIIIATRSKSPLRLKWRAGDHQPIAPHLEWDKGEWRKIDRRLRPKTLLQIADGRRRLGARFLAPYYSSGSGLIARSIDRPIGTITTRDRWALVDGDRMRMANVSECRAAMSFRADYKLPEGATLAKHMLGNAICPAFAAAIIREVRHAA